MWREVRVQENKEEERQTEREGFKRRFMHVFILKKTEGTCSFKANKSCGNTTKTYFPLSTLQLKTIVFLFFANNIPYSPCCLFRILLLWFQVELMCDLIYNLISNQGNGPSSVHKSCQNKLFPDPTPSLIFLLTSRCAVQSERLEQASV